MLTAAILTALMQVGANPSAVPAPAIPPELWELRERQKKAENANVEVLDALTLCLERAETDSTAAVMESQSKLKIAEGLAKAEAWHCLGYAQANLSQWAEAAKSFAAARNAAAESNSEYRARLGAMIGSAYLTAGDLLPALAALNAAKKDAATAEFGPLGGEIELDRARTLVRLGDTENAALALTRARQLAPLSSRAWLLSAVLARRAENLADATTYVAQALRLDSSNAETLLEAGVIAVLSGDEATAKLHWEKLVAQTESTPHKATAQNYLEQISEQ